MSNLDSTLLHIYRLLLRTPKIAAHLPEILDLVMHSTNAERGQIELYDEQGDLRFREARKEGKEIRDRRESKISGKILAWVWENKRSVLSEDARRDPSFRGSGTVVGQNVLSVICAPVCDARGLFGVLYLDSSKREALFNENTKRFLDELVEQLAPALRQRMAEEAKLRSIALELRNTHARELGYRTLIGTSPAIKRVRDDIEFANLHDDD
ncbi:MAG: GAF domain-containing protein, partial [candidate division KSB1 bacterium]